MMMKRFKWFYSYFLSWWYGCFQSYRKAVTPLHSTCHSIIYCSREVAVKDQYSHTICIWQCSACVHFQNIILERGIRNHFSRGVIIVSSGGEVIFSEPSLECESKFVPGVTMALLECPPPWNSIVPKASVGLSCVCLLMDHFSDRLSFLAKRSVLSFWLDEMPGGRPTCWPIRRPQQHLGERPEWNYT